MEILGACEKARWREHSGGRVILDTGRLVKPVQTGRPQTGAAPGAGPPCRSLYAAARTRIRWRGARGRWDYLPLSRVEILRIPAAAAILTGG